MNNLSVTSANCRAICVIGVDGTGKTSHALRIVSYLQKTGRRTRYQWFGSPHLFSIPFMIFCRIIGLTKIYHLPTGKYSEHQYYKNKPVAMLWPWIQLLDLIVFVFVHVNVSNLLKTTVVCDRFVQDALVGIMDDIDDEELNLKLVGRTITRLQPRSSFVVLLDIDERTAMERKNDIPHAEYIFRRRKFYRLVATSLQIPIVNANKPFLAVNKELISKIEASSFCRHFFPIHSSKVRR